MKKQVDSKLPLSRLRQAKISLRSVSAWMPHAYRAAHSISGFVRVVDWNMWKSVARPKSMKTTKVVYGPIFLYIEESNIVDALVCIKLNYYYYNYNRFTALWILSGTTWVSRYQLGKTKTNLDFLEQETVSGSGISWAICKSAPCHRQITMPSPHHSVFFTGRMPFLLPNRRRQSKKWMIIVANANVS